MKAPPPGAYVTGKATQFVDTSNSLPKEKPEPLTPAEVARARTKAWSEECKRQKSA